MENVVTSVNFLESILILQILWKGCRDFPGFLKTTRSRGNVKERKQWLSGVLLSGGGVQDLVVRVIAVISLPLSFGLLLLGFHF